MRLIQYTFIALIISSSCSSQDRVKLSADYNNKGIDLLFKVDRSENEGEQNKLLEKAILYFDSSISVNPTATNFENKVKTQCRLQQYDEALKTIQDWRKAGVTPENTAMKGFILETKRDTTEANKCYLLAIELYKERMPKSKNPALDKVNIAFLRGFTESPDAAKKEMHKIAKENPKDEKVKFLLEGYEHFDKKEFMSQMWK